jgi:PAS domain S-box-containing protein
MSGAIDNKSMIEVSEQELTLLRALRRAFDDTSIISVTDARGVITYANTRFEQISGYSKSELVGQTHSLVNSKHHPPEFWRDMWKTVASGKIWTGEVCNRAKAGHSYWVHSSIAAIKDASGNVAGYISIRHDITQAKRLETDLRNGQRFQELIMETAPVGVFRTDSEGACNYVNSTWSKITGLSYEGSLNDGWITAIHPDDKYQIFGTWGDFVTGQSEFEMRWRFLRPDGTVRWVQGKASPVRSESGKILSYLGACVDVTELIATSHALETKQNEILGINTELQLKAREIERASQAKSMFLANMSHEIRTPLNGVLGMSQLLAESHLPEKQSGLVKDIIDSGEMLRGIINDLLDFSKIDAGSMSLESRAFSPRDAIEKTIALVSRSAAAKKLNLSVTLSSDIPGHALGDELRFRQIVLNLVGNAIKFTSAGSVTVTADWISQTSGTGEFVMRVADTGIGMTEEQLRRLFNPFSQADESITRKFGGTGLGLTIAKRLAELMSGTITVSSTPGQGSIFTFRVTLTATDAPATAGSAEAGTDTNIEHLRVLVAEDNTTNQKLIKLIFQKLNLPVTIAGNGLEALKLANDETWDVILMDLQMPEMGGIDATKAIRSGQGPSRDTPVFALTANAFEDDKRACFAVGMNGFMAKPLRLSELEATLRSIAASVPAATVRKVG